MTHYANYCGREDCRSLAAIESEESGRLPLTRAIPIVASRAGCTQAAARKALVGTHDGEWHHTGNRARRTNYYDVDAAVRAADPAIARAYVLAAAKAKLLRQRDCTRLVARHSTASNWARHCDRSIAFEDMYLLLRTTIRPGNHAALRYMAAVGSLLIAARDAAMSNGQMGLPIWSWCLEELRAMVARQRQVAS